MVTVYYYYYYYYTSEIAHLYATKVNDVVAVYLHSFLTLAVVEGVW